MAQQVRSHDAFLFKYMPNKNRRIDVGLALNSDTQSGIDNLYSNVVGYKPFQYAWYHGDFNKLSLSFLMLNTGIEYLENKGLPNEAQTIRLYANFWDKITYESGEFNANVSAYLQIGKSLDKKM